MTVSPLFYPPPSWAHPEVPSKGARRRCAAGSRARPHDDLAAAGSHEAPSSIDFIVRVCLCCQRFAHLHCGSCAATHCTIESAGELLRSQQTLVTHPSFSSTSEDNNPILDFSTKCPHSLLCSFSVLIFRCVRFYIGRSWRACGCWLHLRSLLGCYMGTALPIHASQVAAVAAWRLVGARSSPKAKARANRHRIFPSSRRSSRAH